MNLIYIFILILIIIIFYVIKIKKLSLKTIYYLSNSFYYIYIKNILLKDKNKKTNIRFTCENILQMCNINIIQHGIKFDDKPILYIVNHSSYLDSIIIKYLLPNVFTIAKLSSVREFRSNIIKNILHNILDTWNIIYYKRGCKKSGKKVRTKIVKYLKNGKQILLYPEGKSTPNMGPQTFYPGSFETSFENNLLIQPITIKYETDINWGIPNQYCKEHNINILSNINECQKKINNVNVIFHKLVYPKNFKDHLQLKKYCEIVITNEWIKKHNYK